MLNEMSGSRNRSCSRLRNWDFGFWDLWGSGEAGGGLGMRKVTESRCKRRATCELKIGGSEAGWIVRIHRRAQIHTEHTISLLPVANCSASSPRSTQFLVESSLGLQFHPKLEM